MAEALTDTASNATGKASTGMGAVLAAAGEAGRLMQEVDWGQTPLGPIGEWPQSLRSAVSICLLSRFPMVVWWGPELVFIFNDAYRPVLGVKDPRQIMGRVGREVWPEIWPIIGPMLDGVMRAGEATWNDDGLLYLERNGYLEECYFTFSYSPINDETGGVGGVFTAVTETTQRVLGERRLRTLGDLSKNTTHAKTAEEACALAVESMADNAADIPFALLYLVTEDGSAARLTASTGAPEWLGPAAHSIRLGDPDGVWPLAEVGTTGEARRVDGLKARAFRKDEAPPPDDPPDTALVLPIAQAGQASTTGMLVVGVSPRRELDGDYQRFFELIASQVGSAIADARAYSAERKRAEALAELDRAKTTFFSNISHEFRTPLTLLLGPLEQAIEAPRPEQLDNLKVAHRNAMRLLRLVNTLLDFSRIEAGRIEASYEPVDLSELTSELASAFRSAVEAAGLRLTVDCAPLAEAAYVDVEMWEKIVLNLISNAFKFTLEGEIVVRTSMSAEGFQVSVSDTGAGIPEDELPRLFDRFYRVKGARSRTHEGTGIGLALVHELVQLHHGKIQVESAPGVGSTFTITIPRGKDHLPADRLGASRGIVSTAVGAAPFVEEARRWLPETGAEPALPTWTDETSFQSVPGGLQEARVLVVDDNADMRDYLVGLLSRVWTVDAAPDGTAALERIRASVPDLVLTDVMMPGMDGFELLRRLRSVEQTRHIPVVMLSARAGEEATVEGLLTGADDYLVKPFAARELIARVRANLELSRMRLVTRATLARFDEAERVLSRALASMTAVAQHIRAGVDLQTLIGRLSATVAELVGSRRAVFLRLENGEVRAMAAAYGFEPEILAEMRAKVSPQGHDIVDRIVFQDEVFNARIDDSPAFAPYRRQIELLQARNGIAVSWRAGSTPLGLVAAYDSNKPDGFSSDDVWVLRIAALAAALVLEHKGAQDELAAVNEREASRLREQLEQSAQLERAKSEFLRLASHELRAPLTVLGGYLSLVKNGTLGELTSGVLDAIPVMDAKVREMRSLVDQMLDTARLEDRKLVLKRSRVDLRRVVSATLDLMRPALGTTHTLTVSLPKQPVPVDADEARLGTVISNIVDNAIRYSPRGGAIRVQCEVRPETDEAIIEVTDQGLGIARQDQRLLFTRFGRIVTPENSHISGTGLGLYLAKELIGMHGGSITVASEPDKGSTFTIMIPLVSSGSHEAASVR